MPRSFVELSPQNFSFNSPLGWCPACEGLGVERGTNQESLIPNPNLSLREGAIGVWPQPSENAPFLRMLVALGDQLDISLDTPWYQLDPLKQRVVLYGSEQWIECEWPLSVTTIPDAQSIRDGSAPSGLDRNEQPSLRKRRKKSKTSSTASPETSTIRFQYKGLYPAFDEASRTSYEYRSILYGLMGEKPCSVCSGDRMREDAAAVRLEGLTLPQLSRLPLTEVLDYLKTLQLDAEQQKIAGDLLSESIHRLEFLVDVGLHYLSLDRGMPTLSGGESQRIRLAGQIGRALTGVLYVLDEPTIGLHPRDNGKLISALNKLRDLGNTLVLVEHDREVLESADRLYDFGPGSGRFGGNVVAEGISERAEEFAERIADRSVFVGNEGNPGSHHAAHYPTRLRASRRREHQREGRLRCPSRRHLARHHQLSAEQPAWRRSVCSTRCAHVCDRLIGFGEEFTHPRNARPRGGSASSSTGRSTGTVRRTDWRRADQQDHRSRSATTGGDARIEPGHVHGGVRSDP